MKLLPPDQYPEANNAVQVFDTENYETSLRDKDFTDQEIEVKLMKYKRFVKDSRSILKLKEQDELLNGKQYIDTAKRIDAIKNETGLADWWRDKSPNFESFPISQDEYDALAENGILWELNKEFNLNLDEFESDLVTEHLYEILDRAGVVKDIAPNFYQAIKTAAEYGYGIVFSF